MRGHKDSIQAPQLRRCYQHPAEPTPAQQKISHSELLFFNKLW
jgi:hypothetical protein